MVPRPRKGCRIGGSPKAGSFKPTGVPRSSLDQAVLTHAEFEALRLKDFESLDQNECAEKMGVSQSTFHRLLLGARQKVSDALVNGKEIIFETTNQ